MSELYDIEELPDGTFTISFKITERNQHEDPLLTENSTAKNIPRVLFEKYGIPYSL